MLVAVGCGPSGNVGPATPAQKSDAALNDIGEIYRIFLLTNKKPPTKIGDLAGFQNVGSTGVAALKSGEVVVLYGAMMTDTNEGPASTSSNEVLAYEKKVPESGGKVLMLDRTVREMTADEFKAAPKAGK